MLFAAPRISYHDGCYECTSHVFMESVMPKHIVSDTIIIIIIAIEEERIVLF